MMHAYSAIALHHVKTIRTRLNLHNCPLADAGTSFISFEREARPVPAPRNHRGESGVSILRMSDIQHLLSNEDGASERSKRYYADLRSVDVLPSCLSVRRCGSDSRTTGKGVFAEADLVDSAVLLRERPLLSMQHEGNKQHCLVCSNCLRFIGGIEAQILHRLDRDTTVGSGESTADATEVGHATYDDVSKDISAL